MHIPNELRTAYEDLKETIDSFNKPVQRIKKQEQPLHKRRTKGKRK